MRVSFRDQAIADLPAFINVDEFGAVMLINGASMACVLVNDEAPTEEDGVAMIESTLYVRASDFARAPAVRERMTVGDKIANIVRVDEEQGMLVIRLRWFE